MYCHKNAAQQGTHACVLMTTHVHVHTWSGNTWKMQRIKLQPNTRYHKRTLVYHICTFVYHICILVYHICTLVYHICTLVYHILLLHYYYFTSSLRWLVVSSLTCGPCSDARLHGFGSRSQHKSLKATVSITKRYSHSPVVCVVVE